MLLRRVDSITPPNDSSVIRGNDIFPHSQEHPSVFAARHRSAMLAFRITMTIMLASAARHRSAMPAFRITMTIMLASAARHCSTMPAFRNTMKITLASVA